MRGSCDGGNAAAERFQPEAQASLARRKGLGAAHGPVNGIVFTIGLWLALAGLVPLILR